MTLNRNSTFLRCIFMMEIRGVPHSISLCPLFWRVVLMILAAPVIGLFLALLFVVSSIGSGVIYLRNRFIPFYRQYALYKQKKQEWYDYINEHGEYPDWHYRDYDPYLRNNGRGEHKPSRIITWLDARLMGFFGSPVWPILWQGIKTVKGKVCPIIYLKD